MFPGVNKRQMQQMMKKMGMNQIEIDAEQVIIKCGDKELIIDNPQVSKVNMMGQNTFQIVGEETERLLDTTPEITEEDIKTVANQADVSEDVAKETLIETNGDIAEAIINLTE